MDPLVAVVLSGVGATAFTDLWALLRRRWLQVPFPDYAMVGRWIGHFPKGRFRHRRIADAAPVAHEGLLGWSAHYAIGIAFAGLLALGWGAAWFARPTLIPALLVGVLTVAAPYLLMQPGMGAGIAARLTPNPGKARLHSLVMHAMFGLGLYASAIALASIPR